MTLCEDSLKNDQVRHNFSRHADEYDRYALVQKSVALQLMERISDPTVQGRTLEVGCGTGILSRMFFEKYSNASLILSDLAHGMSCRVAARFPNQSVVDGDAVALPFSENSFDLVLSSSVYQWVDHLSQAFSELHRVLKPGGQVAMALFGEKTLYELHHSHVEASTCGQSHSQGFPDYGQVQKSLNGQFEIELLESSLEVEWHQTVPCLLRSLKAIGAQNASRQRPAGFASRRMMQRMYDCYENRFGRDGMVPATYEVIYLRVRKN